MVRGRFFRAVISFKTPAPAYRCYKTSREVGAFCVARLPRCYGEVGSFQERWLVDLSVPTAQHRQFSFSNYPDLSSQGWCNIEHASADRIVAQCLNVFKKSAGRCDPIAVSFIRKTSSVTVRPIATLTNCEKSFVLIPIIEVYAL